MMFSTLNQLLSLDQSTHTDTEVKHQSSVFQMSRFHRTAQALENYKGTFALKIALVN